MALTTVDARLLCIILEAGKEYMAYDRLSNNFETFHAFCLLIAIKRGASAYLERWIPDNANPSLIVPLLAQADTLAMRFRGRSLPRWKQDHVDDSECALGLIKILQGRSLVLWLAYNEFYEAASLLLEASDVLIPDSGDILRLLSPLYAVINDCYHVLSLLIQEGMDPNSRIPSSGWALLQVAALHGSSLSVEQLLKAGADVNAPPGEERGRTALLAAAEGGHQAVVEQLLKSGVDVTGSSGTRAIKLAEK